MFYAATQLDDENAGIIWKIPAIAIQTVSKHLKQIEDSVV